jgi:Ser/Thr protein kinase RdoA (MazF antagonist)
LRSKTKLAVDAGTIVELFESAGIAGARNVSPLGAGEYNSVYAVDAGEKEYAIKIAPGASARVLTYEQQMMTQEVYYYGLMATRAGISVPHIYCADFSRSKFPSEYFVMERLRGVPMDRARLSRQQKAQVEAKLAELVARLHAVKGEQFGYRQNGLHDNWHLALRAMTANLIEDCRGLGRRTSRGERLLGYIDRNQRLLEGVECSLINFDVWPPNIFCDWDGGELHLSWIDPERCLWGDRIADFVCLDFGNMTLDGKTAALQAYNQASSDPLAVGDGERIRFAIMLGYLALIMEVEKYVRHTVLHYGYWRNVLAASILFSACFKQLDELMR